MKEVEKQVENVLTVTVKKFGKMGKEKLEMGTIKGIFVKIAVFDLVGRQFYQLLKTIVLGVKYA